MMNLLKMVKIRQIIYINIKMKKNFLKLREVSILEIIVMNKI